MLASSANLPLPGRSGYCQKARSRLRVDGLGLARGQETLIDGNSYGFFAGRCVEFAHDGGHVMFNGSRRQEQSVGDIDVGETLAQELQHFGLPTCEAGTVLSSRSGPPARYRYSVPA